MLAEVLDRMAVEFQVRDGRWGEAVMIAEEACARANEMIAARCLDLGIQSREAPKLELVCRSREPQFALGWRRAELRQLARARLAALTAAAKSLIDKQAQETETALVADRPDAVTILDRMPTVEELMPALSLSDLGVEPRVARESGAAATTASS